METFDAYIEIPSGSRNKYEFDFEMKKIRFDRILYSSMKYPTEYGFIPNTFALDGDPLDVLVLSTEPFFPGILVEVRAIGVLNMIDSGDEDYKIICVPVADPFFNNYNDIDDVNVHKKKEIEYFFQVYKDLQNKKVELDGFGNKEVAIKMVQACKERFNALDDQKKSFFSI